MKKVAITKANDRLTRAKRGVANVQNSRNFHEFEQAWSYLLINGNAVHSILEKGAMADPRSRQWYGGKKRERRNDPLLSYMHQARNSDEHGLEPVARHNPGYLGIGMAGESAHIGRLTTGARGEITELRMNPTPGPVTIAQIPPHPELIPVIDDRFGTKFDPPKEHLGAPLADISARAIAKLWVDYLSALVEEATKLGP